MPDLILFSAFAFQAFLIKDGEGRGILQKEYLGKGIVLRPPFCRLKATRGKCLCETVTSLFLKEFEWA